MASLATKLPAPSHHDPMEIEQAAPMQRVATIANIPPYGKRKGWVPRKEEDFGDGGAFPEIHVAQYPLDMGRKGKSADNQLVALQTDATGRVRYDALARQGQRDGKVVHSQYSDLLEKNMGEDALKKPDEDEIQENLKKTKAALLGIVDEKVAASHVSHVNGADRKSAPTYIRYTPANQAQGFNSGASNRIIRVTELPQDPMEPPKFKHKRVPKGPPSPPVPVMHSPPRKVTVKDQQDWKIPPCISNWKNAKGFTIPLDKRLAADGRGLQEVQISDNFAKLSESLYLAERNAREEVENRAQIQKKMMMKDKAKKEEELRNLAMKARQERAEMTSEVQQIEEEGDEETEEAARERDQLRMERKRDRERERRLEAKEGKRSKMTRERDRDISERIALGEAAPSNRETLYDARLFNQSQGVASGFGHEDDYNIYDKALFAGSSANEVYKPKQVEADEYSDEDTAVSKVMKNARFKAPDKGFSGADGAGPSGGRGSGPVQFEDDAEADPFGLDQFLTQASKGKKAMDGIGGAGHMAPAAGGSTGESSGRQKVDFEKSRR